MNPLTIDSLNPRLVGDFFFALPRRRYDLHSDRRRILPGVDVGVQDFARRSGERASPTPRFIRGEQSGLHFPSWSISPITFRRHGRRAFGVGTEGDETTHGDVEKRMPAGGVRKVESHSRQATSYLAFVLWHWSLSACKKPPEGRKPSGGDVCIGWRVERRLVECVLVLCFDSVRHPREKVSLLPNLDQSLERR